MKPVGLGTVRRKYLVQQNATEQLRPRQSASHLHPVRLDLGRVRKHMSPPMLPSSPGSACPDSLSPEEKAQAQRRAGHVLAENLASSGAPAGSIEESGMGGAKALVTRPRVGGCARGSGASVTPPRFDAAAAASKRPAMQSCQLR